MAEELGAINIQIKGLAEVQERLKDFPNGMKRALPDAIRRALVRGRQVASDAIRTRYMAKASWVKESIGTPTVAGMSGHMRSRSTKAPLAMFPHTDLYPLGVSVRELARAERMRVKHGFTPAGINKVFVRAGGRGSVRYPLREMVGLSVPEMLEDMRDVHPVVEKEIEEMLYKRLNDNVDRILAGKWKI
jgi:hypothetical protein